MKTLLSFRLAGLGLIAALTSGCVAYPVYSTSPVAVNPVVVSQPVYQSPPVYVPPAYIPTPVYTPPPVYVYPRVYTRPCCSSHGSVYYSNSNVSIGLNW